MVYDGDHLYHAYFDGSTWSSETIDPYPAVVSNASLAIEASDTIHIAYFDVRNEKLKYATNALSDWEVASLPLTENPSWITPTPPRGSHGEQESPAVTLLSVRVWIKVVSVTIARVIVVMAMSVMASLPEAKMIPPSVVPSISIFGPLCFYSTKKTPKDFNDSRSFPGACSVTSLSRD